MNSNIWKKFQDLLLGKLGKNNWNLFQEIITPNLFTTKFHPIRPYLVIHITLIQFHSNMD